MATVEELDTLFQGESAKPGKTTVAELDELFREETGLAQAETYRREAARGTQGGVELTPGLNLSYRRAAQALERTPTIGKADALAGVPVVPPVVTAERLKEVPEPLLPGLPAPVSDVVRSAVTKAVQGETGAIAEVERAGRVPTREAAGMPPVYPGETAGLKPETISAVPERPGLATQAGRAFVRAPIRMAEQIGTGLQVGAEALPESEASRAIKRAGREVERHWQAVARKFPSGYEGRHIWQEPSLLVDPGYLTSSVIEMTASMLPAIGGFGAGQAAFTVLGRSLPLTAQNVVRLARLGGAVVGSGIGGLQEGMGTYQEARRRGMTDAQAATHALLASLAIAGLNAVPLLNQFAARDPGVKAALGKFFKVGVKEAVTEAAEEPLEAGLLSRGDVQAMVNALKEGGLDVAVPAFLSGGLFSGVGGVTMAPRGANVVPAIDAVLSNVEARTGLKSQREVVLERARLLRSQTEIPPSEASVPQPEAIPAAAEAGLARRGIGPPEAKAVPPEVKAAAPEIKAIVDQFRRPVEAAQPETAPSGPLRTAKELVGAVPEVTETPAERQIAAQAKLAAETALRRYQDVPSTFYEFARERGRWPIAPTDPGYMAIRREWDEIRRPLYEIQGPRLGQWEVVNRVTKEIEAQAPNRAMAQLQANRMDRARMRPMPPEQLRPLPPVKPAEPPVAPPAEAERPEPKPLVAPSVTPEVARIEDQPEVVKPKKVKPIADALGGEPEGFNPNDVDQLAKFVMEHGGIAPSPTGDLKGEYAAIPLRYKNRRGLNPDLMAQAVSEAAGRTVADHEILGRLAHLGRLRAEKAASAKAQAGAPRAEIETEELRNLPEDVKIRRITAMTGLSEAEALKMVQRPEAPEFLTPEMERAERDIAELHIAVRDYYSAVGPDESPTPGVLDQPFFERFGGAERITQEFFNGNRDLVVAALETAKQDVAEGRVQEERDAYGRIVGEEPPKYERTPEGDQALVPGAEARQIPTTPLRPEAPQRPVQDTPLFAEGKRAEQPMSAVKARIAQEFEKDSFPVYGLRVLGRRRARVGEVLPPSREFADDHPTGRKLQGTSAIDVRDDNIDQALNLIRDYGDEGGAIVLLGAQSKLTEGRDPGEVLLQAPRILAVLGHQFEGAFRLGLPSGLPGVEEQRAAYRATVESEPFRRWFGTSKVVEEDGSPKVVYHGTGQPGFEAVDPRRLDPQALYGRGFYTTESPDIAGGVVEMQTDIRFFPTKEAAEAAPNRSGFVWSTGPEYHENQGKWAAAINVPQTKYRGYVAKGRQAEGLHDLATRGRIETALRASRDFQEKMKPGYLSASEREFVERQIPNWVQSGNPGIVDVLSDQPYNLRIKDAIERELGTGAVYPLYLKIERPFDVDAPVTGDTVDRLSEIVSLRTRADHMLSDALERAGADLRGISDNWASWGRGAARVAVPDAYARYEAMLEQASKLPTVDPRLFREEVEKKQAVARTVDRRALNGDDVYDALRDAVLGTGRSVTGDATKILAAAGFDGITHTGGKITGAPAHRVWIAFEPTQVKSAIGNVGTFAPTEPSILREAPTPYGKPAPATFLGYQEGVGGREPVALYNLTERVGERPAGDTVSATTLRDAGLEPPATPTFEEWKRTQGVEEGVAPYREPDQDLVQRAKRQYGTTTHWREAGWIMPDGTMLDLSGRHYATGYEGGKPLEGQPDYLRGQRGVDHREGLTELVGREGDQADRMRRFAMQSGAIRFMPDVGISLESGQQPTDAQLTAIIRAARQFSDETLSLDMYDERGHVAGATQLRRPTVEAVRSFLASPRVEEGVAPYGPRQVGELAPPFFSGLQRLIEDKMPVAAPAVMVRNIIKQAKPEEVKWSGLDDWLAERGGHKITKAEVLDVLRQNEVRVEEVTLGESRGLLRWDQLGGGVWMGYHRDTNQLGGYSIEELRNGRFLARSVRSGLQESFDAFDEAAQWVETSRANAGENVRQTKWRHYVLPGAEPRTYRELLLILPRRVDVRTTREAGARLNAANNAIGAYMRDYPGAVPARDAELARLTAARDRISEDMFAARGREAYRSPHWDEPNVLAHVRFNDRTDADGKKVLFIEELQSDWHAEGRRKGYAEPAAEPELTQNISGLWAWFVGDRQVSGAFEQRSDAMTSEARSTIRAERGVPTAPFVKTWHELAMKRTLRYAAENGYDKVAWTTGEQQAERYDLSKQVDEIDVGRNSEGYFYHAMKGGNALVSKAGMTKDQLAENIGKDLADKALRDLESVESGGYKQYSGLDLKVGGEGMRGFYDKILPEFLNRYAKRWGARVGAVQLPMRQSLEVKNARNHYGEGPNEWMLLDRLTGEEWTNPETGHPTRYTTEVGAREWLVRQGQMGGLRVPALDITSAMRRSVMEEGQALFEGRKEYTFRDDTSEAQRTAADHVVARVTGPLAGLSHPGVPVGNQLPTGRGIREPAPGLPTALPGGRRGAGVEQPRSPLKEGAGVRVLGAKIGGELARRGRVTFAGQRLETEEDLARIGQIASDPQVESFRVIPVKDGIALPDSVLSARLPGTAPVFLDFSPEQADRIAQGQIDDIRQLPRPVWETIERLKRLGADGYWLLHNHPGTTPKPSSADIAVTDLFRKAVPGFQGHVVIDDKAYGVIRPARDVVGAVTFTNLISEVVPAEFATRSRELLRDHPLIGQRLRTYDDMATIGRSMQGMGGGVILYRAADGTVGALELAPYRFIAGPNFRDHLLARMPEYGSQEAFIYLPKDSRDVVNALDPLIKQGLVRDLLVQDFPSVSETRTGAEEVGAENAYRRLMQRFSRERQYRVHEEGAPYTDPGLLRDLADYGQEIRRTKPDFDSWAEAMRKEFGERVEPQLGRAWDEMRRSRRASTTPSGEPVDVQIEKAGPPTVEGLTQPQLVLQKHKQAVDTAAEQLLVDGGITRDKTVLLSDQILDMMVAGKLNLEAIERVLPQGMTVAEFGQDLWRPAISDAARRLQVLSVLERRINKLLVDGKVPESARAELDATLLLARIVDEGVVMQAWWRRFDNVRRGMLVTQLATAVRNFASQVGRLGMDVLDLGLQRAIQKAAGVKPSANPWEAIRAFSEVFAQIKPEEFRRLKGEVDQIFEAFPRQHDRLFGTYSSDIMAQARERAKTKARKKMGAVERTTDTALTGAENVVNLLNWANRGQEWIVRRAVFQTHLDEALTRRGTDLSELVSRGETAKIPEAAIKEAVSKALELTWATPPKYGTAAWHFVKLMNLGAPLTTSILPFPRFMTNALRFQYEFSPLGFLPVAKHLISAGHRKAVLAGDAKAISRATIGSAMFLTAYVLRLAQDNDNKWYEISVPGQARPVDVRPFNPFAAYLFVAELTKRMLNGTLYDKLNWTEILQGIASANLRAGTGLYALEQVIAGLGEMDDLKKAKEAGQRALGEYVAGFLMPFQQAKDFLAPFVTDMAQVKDRSLEPFLGPLKDRLPGLVELGLADPLPPAYSPTRAEPIRREAPALRQVTGITLAQEKNPAEKELARFQFDRKEILPKSGDPLFDNLWSKHMGQLVEERLGAYVTGEAYRRLPDGARMERLRDRLIPLRAIAKGRATREIREMGEGERLKAMKEEAIPRRERLYRDERRQQREESAR